MKQFRIVLAVVLTLGIGGCAGGIPNPLNIISAITTPVQNPITRERLYDIENSLTVAVSGMLAYKRLCVRKVIASSCRGVVATLQSYTTQAKPVLITLRRFVKENDQVNAITAYNTVKQLLTNFQQVATANGV